MKHILSLLGLVFVLMAMAIQPVQAQIGNGRLYTFDLDTLTNADTITLDFPWQLNDEYDYAVEVACTNISGTTAVTAKLQESVGGSNYAVTDTVAFSAAGTELLTGQTVGRHQRYFITSSGTQSTSVKVWVWYQRVK